MYSYPDGGEKTTMLLRTSVRMYWRSHAETYECSVTNAVSSLDTVYLQSYGRQDSPPEIHRGQYSTRFRSSSTVPQYYIQAKPG